MSDFSTAWHGTPPSTNLTGYTPYFKAPSTDFSFKLYDFLSQMIGQPAPRWGGFGGMSRQANRTNPFSDQMLQAATQYSQLGLPQIFGQAIGSLGKYMNPTPINPVARMQLGGVNYFGQNAIPSPFAGMQPQQNPWMMQNMGGG